MKFEYRDCEIFYNYIDRKSDTTDIYLHGWGCDHTSLFFCKDISKNSCLFVDFPPFGKSGKHPKDWNVFTYANMLIFLCKKLNIRRFNLVGHSFGWRIAIITAMLCKDEINSLVLVDSAGVKPRRSLEYYIKVWSYKLKKKLKMDVSKYGSCDYLALDSNMRKVFGNIVNTHLDEYLPYIKCDTLIIFGMQDQTTPIYMAKRIHKNIKNSKLCLLEGAGHFPFVDRRLEFAAELKEFLLKR